MVYPECVTAGELLKATRAARGLGQAELARRAGTTQNYISRIERGVVSPSFSTLERLMHAMGRRLVVGSEPLPIGNASRASLRSHRNERTAEARVREAMALSEFLTTVSAAARDG